MQKKQNYNAGLTMVRLKTKYLCLAALFLACKHEPYYYAGGYPKEVGEIILNKCATSGCHNDKSYTGAGGLNLTTWSNLFKGGNGGSAVIPYRPDFSTLCFYTNTDTSLGITLEPTMPEGGTPLTKSEYATLYNWIATGAANADGKVAFAENPARKKLYVANRLCDVVTVFDRGTFLQMRYIDIGTKPVPDLAESILVSPDKKHWYVSFFGTTDVIQKFDAANDLHIADIRIGSGNWLSFTITNNSKHAYFIDNNNPGRIAYVNLESNKLQAIYDFSNQLQYPQGIALNEQIDKLYIGTGIGNFVYVVNISDKTNPSMKQIPIDGSSQIMTNSSINPAILCTGENNICYIACQKTHEIRIMNMVTDKIIAVIPLPGSPQSVSYSYSTDRLFVTCPNDSFSFPGTRGSVIVVDVVSNTIVKRIKSGYEPYSIAIDDESMLGMVTNANLHTGGPAPHHSTKCGGRNGNVVFIDLYTLEIIPGKKSEVAVFPYSATAR